MESQLIKRLLDKEEYDKYSQYIVRDLFTFDKIVSPFWSVYEKLDHYYQNNSDPISAEELEKIHMASMGGAHEKQREKIMLCYEELREVESSAPAGELLHALRANGLRSRAQLEIEKGNVGAAIDLLSESEKEEEAQEKDEEEVMSFDLSENLEEDEEGTEWFLPKLNCIIGKFNKSKNYLIVARTNAGKTSFICPAMIKLMREGKKVLHFALSEDSKNDLRMRYYQAAFQVTENKILENPEYYQNRFVMEFGDKLRVRVTARKHVKEIEAIIKEEKPDAVVYDQYQKMFVSEKAANNSTTEHRTAIVQYLKDFQKKYGHGFICATQAARTAREYVTEHDIDYSATGVPGEFRTIIGIGFEGDGKQLVHVSDNGTTTKGFERIINVCKNKGPMGDFKTVLIPDICKWLER